MKKFLFGFLTACVVLLLASLISPAFAHRGNTDSQGGHWDYSTGEYHYHHGYGPHQHTDLDGDGYLDCPYDFKDKTNHSSGSSSSSGSTHHTYVTPKPTPRPDPVKKPGLKFGDVVGLIVQFTMGGFALLMFIGLPIEEARKRKKDREMWEKKRMEEEAERKRLAAEKAEQEKLAAEAERRKFLAEKAEYTKLYGNVSTAVAAGAHEDCYLDENGLPATTLNLGDELWGHEFTFYATYAGKRYHTRTCKVIIGHDVCQKNAYALAPIVSKYGTRQKYLPCPYCKPVLPDMQWVSKYKEIVEIKEKYDIT